MFAAAAAVKVYIVYACLSCLLLVMFIVLLRYRVIYFCSIIVLVAAVVSVAYFNYCLLFVFIFLSFISFLFTCIKTVRGRLFF